MWSPEVYGEEAETAKWTPIKSALADSDGVVVVSPEYNGMVSSTGVRQRGPSFVEFS